MRKKIVVLVGMCMLLACMPMMTAAPSFGMRNSVLQPRTLSRGDGTFSGVFAEKNETGYNMLGNLSGDYSMGPGPFGSFSGVWEMDDESAEGAFSGYIIYRFFLGQYNVTDSEQTGEFIGLFKVNQTSNEFMAISLVFTDAGHDVRYALGTLQESP
jgi:hypothetical protein